MLALPKIFIAIDKADLKSAEELAMMATNHHCGLKLGHEFFTSFGPEGVKQIKSKTALVGDTKVFLDLKLYDIPNTVAGGVRAALEMGVDYLTLHCQGGFAMMEKAQMQIDETDAKLKLIGVTVLTSMDAADLQSLGFSAKIVKDQVLRLAELAARAGIQHLVCAPHEITPLRDEFGDQFHLITPGVRPQGADLGDQKRVMTPAQALQKGASALVIGRPITANPNPEKALIEILNMT